MCITTKRSEQSRDLARISKLPIFLNNSACPKLSKMALNGVKWSIMVIFLSKKTGRWVASLVPGAEHLPKLFGGVFVHPSLIYFSLDFDLTWLLQEWWDFSKSSKVLSNILKISKGLQQHAYFLFWPRNWESFHVHRIKVDVDEVDF